MSEAIRARIGAELERTRGRTTVLTDAVDGGDLVKQHSPLMSPLVWDLAHVGNQEELWLVRDVGGLEPVRCDIDNLYDAFKNPRRDRPSLPLLSPDEARAYNHTVRNKVLDILDRTPLSGRRLVDDGFAFGMIVQHEQQHDETMLATHQLRVGPAVLSAPPPPAPRAPVAAELLVPGGRFEMGTSAEPWALDNERPAHHVDVPAFLIDAAPVTNAQYAEFIADGGYEQPRWWTPEGWAHRVEAGLSAPMHWTRDGDGWGYTSSSVTCGSGWTPTSTGTRASPPSRTASTPRSSSARSTRCCAVARSVPTPPRAGARSATGTTRSAGRSSAASAAPVTPG